MIGSYPAISGISFIWLDYLKPYFGRIPTAVGDGDWEWGVFQDPGFPKSNFDGAKHSTYHECGCSAPYQRFRDCIAQFTVSGHLFDQPSLKLSIIARACIVMADGSGSTQALRTLNPYWSSSVNRFVRPDHPGTTANYLFTDGRVSSSPLWHLLPYATSANKQEPWWPKD